MLSSQPGAAVCPAHCSADAVTAKFVKLVQQSADGALRLVQQLAGAIPSAWGSSLWMVDNIDRINCVTKLPGCRA